MPSGPTAPPCSRLPRLLRRSRLPFRPPSRPAEFETAGLPPQAPGRTAQIERYIAQYKGGDCFLITPNSIGANTARIDGYGRDQAAFEILDDAFKQANGFEADIDVRQVTTPQCPALTFLARLRAERGNGPRLQIGETNLKSGQALIGSIEGVGNDNVQLLLVSDEGQVQDLSPLLKPAGDARTFNLRMQRVGAPGAQPQLLLAFTSARPLETLQGRQIFRRSAVPARPGRGDTHRAVGGRGGSLFQARQVTPCRTSTQRPMTASAIRGIRSARPIRVISPPWQRSSAWTRHRSIPPACWSSAAVTAQISYRSRFSGRRANSSGWT